MPLRFGCHPAGYHVCQYERLHAKKCLDCRLHIRHFHYGIMQNRSSADLLYRLRNCHAGQLRQLIRQCEVILALAVHAHGLQDASGELKGACGRRDHRLGPVAGLCLIFLVYTVRYCCVGIDDIAVLIIQIMNRLRSLRLSRVIAIEITQLLPHGRCNLVNAASALSS